MTLTPEGGAAIPVSVTTTRKVQGGAAIPVYGYMTAPTDGRPAMGGSAIPVRVLTAADLKVNGGQWTLEGRPYAMPVYTAPATTTVMGGPALAVYPVNAWPTVASVPTVLPSAITGVKVWLKADGQLFQDFSLSVPVVSDGDVVGGWQKSGGSHDAIGDPGHIPIYKAAIYGALPAVRWMGLAGWEWLHTNPQVVALPTNSMSFFCVCRPSSVAARSLMSGQAWSSMTFQTDVNGKFQFYWSQQYSLGISTTVLPTDTLSLVGATIDATGNWKIYVNGTMEASGNDAFWLTWAELDSQYFVGGLGSETDWQGDICEMAIFDNVISDANRVGLENYLRRWPIP